MRIRSAKGLIWSEKPASITDASSFPRGEHCDVLTKKFSSEISQILSRYRFRDKSTKKGSSSAGESSRGEKINARLEDRLADGSQPDRDDYRLLNNFLGSQWEEEDRDNRYIEPRRCLPFRKLVNPVSNASRRSVQRDRKPSRLDPRSYFNSKQFEYLSENLQTRRSRLNRGEVLRILSLCRDILFRW